MLPRTFLYRLITILVFFFSFCAVQAQSNAEMEKIFSDKQEHAWYMLHYSNTGGDYYWVEKDSLFSCAFVSCSKIALADIDFDKIIIEKSSNYLVKGTTNPVYILQVPAVKGKPSFTYDCFMGTTFLNTAKTARYDKTVNLDMDSKQTAEKAVAYLQQLANGKSGNNITATGDFDTELLNIVNGLKDNFESLKGQSADDESDDKKWICKKQLEGAISTKIGMGMLHNVYLLADFGEYNTMSTALNMYNRVEEKVTGWKKALVSMVKQEENVNEIIRTQSWLPFDFNDVLDSSMKKFSIKLEMIKTMKLDKDLNKIDLYMVSLLIEK